MRKYKQVKEKKVIKISQIDYISKFIEQQQKKDELQARPRR